MIYVGMDDSKKSIEIAALSTEAELAEMRIANTKAGVRKMVRKLKKRFPEEEMEFAYEAGPGGFVLQRRLVELGQECLVAAPSLTPKRQGNRIKTNRRDAVELARLLKGELLEAVTPPGRQEEADRELCRCRGKIQKDLTRARHRLGHFLLRRGHVYRGTNWTHQHRRWLRSIEWEQGSDRQVFETYLWQVELLEQAVEGVSQQIEQLAETPRYREVVGALKCFRGIETYTALSFVCELYGFGRFESPRGLMNFLGLVPSENSTGDDPHKGPITKAGNHYVRRLLVETAKHYRHRPCVSGRLKRRRKGQPAEVIAHANKAMSRLNQRFIHLTFRGKPPNKVTVALARELVGFLWAVTTQIITEQKQAA